jgi:uncharacterized protein YmfQ (DUF2313 family)
MALIPALSGPNPWRKVVQRLLPPGPLWDLETQPGLAAAADAMAENANGVNNAVRLFVLQAFPGTITYLLDAWIAELDLPWPCADLPTTDAEKRALIAARLAAQGGQSPAYLTDVASAFGIAIVIVEWPFGKTSRFGRARFGTSRFGTTEKMHTFEVQAPSATSVDDRARLECLINAFKPAHSFAVYSYIL